MIKNSSKTEGFGTKLDKVIFIIGCPRSGSTLVEQILSSHPQIGSTVRSPTAFLKRQSDIKKIWQFIPDCLTHLTEEDSILLVINISSQ